MHSWCPAPFQRHAIEDPEREDRLVLRRAGYPLRHQMHLERAHILQPEPVWRAAEATTELRHSMKVGSLRGRRQVAQRHLIDPAAAQTADGLGVGYREHLVG
jgi:hypothetical protein